MPKRPLARLMTWNILTVDQDTSLVRAAEVMHTARISSVLVLADGEPAGILTERDILRALEGAVPREVPAKAVMGRPLVCAPQTLSLHEAYHLMAENGVRHLLVTDVKGRPAGIVSESDFRFHLGMDFFCRLQDVRTVMSAQVPLLPPGAPLREAVAAMASRETKVAVVTEDGRPVGIVTERDAVRIFGQATDLERPVAEVMSTPVATIPVGTRLHDAVDHMHAQRIRHLVVVEQDGRVAGMLSEHDVVRQLENEYLAVALRENRETRQRLRESELRRRGVFNQASEFMGILDMDGTLQDANPSALALVGARLPDVAGKPFWETPWWSHDEALQAQLRQAFAELAHGSPTRFEVSHPGADGSLRVVDFRLQPILDEDGLPALALAEGSDVTELKRVESELRQFQRAVEQCPVSIVITDTDACIQYVNPKFCEITGYSREEVLGRNPRFLQSGLTPAMTYDALWGVLRNGGMWTGELCNRHKNGDIFWEHARILPVTDAAGRVTHFLGVKEDITERRRTEEQRRLALSVFDNSHDGILITDAAGIVLDVNRAFCGITGYSRDEVVGHSCRLLESGHHDAAFFERLFATVAEQGYWQGEIWNRTKAGALGVLLMTLSAVRDDQGILTHYVGVFSDITLKKQSEHHLERLAHYDALTGLPNRSLFRDRLQQALHKCQRDGETLALFFIDLDRFKDVNDSLGHMAGDDLLVEAARRISACVRQSDTVARLGGDEFTVILTGLENEENVARVARKILEVLAAPFRLGEETAWVSASIGITLSPADGMDAEALTRDADRAMYAAKARGRNRYGFFAQRE